MRWLSLLCSALILPSLQGARAEDAARRVPAYHRAPRGAHPASTGARPLALVHALIIDGNGGAPIRNGTILIRGDRITAVGPGPEIHAPPDARIIDVKGGAVMPGLADFHVHLAGGWDGEGVDFLGFNRYLNALLYAGVTTVLDCGNVLPYVQQMRDEIRAGRLAGPEIRMLGPLFDGGTPVWPPISFAISTEEQLPGFLRVVKAAHVDGVKAYGGLSDALLAALVREASKDSLRVIADMWGRNGTAPIARSGIAAFAHLGTVPVTDETIQVMTERHVASITTLVVFESFTRRRLQDPELLTQPLIRSTMPPWMLDEVRAFASLAGDSARVAGARTRFETARANAKRLFDAGILLAAGTDTPYPGVFFGEGLHRELELLVEAGLTPLQAITLATKNAALLLNELARWGTVEPGKRADLLVIDGDPSRRIQETRKIRLVIQRGVVVDRVRLRYDRRRDAGYRISGSVSAPAP